MSSFAMIIEDNEDTASLFSNILEFIGFRTEIIRFPERAFQHLDRTIPDIVLLDIMLGKSISGINILDYIKEQDHLSNCRVIVITGYPNLAESIEDKADLVLLKPISAKQLSTMVLRMVPNHVSESFIYNASHDPLTGLLNYARFKDRLVHAVNRSKRLKSLSFALIFFKLNDYNALLRRHGQLGTSKLLQVFVNRISAEIREVDTFSRLTEDKFAILLEDIKSETNANTVVNRVRSLLDQSITLQGERINLDLQIEVKTNDLSNQLDTFIHQTSG